MTSKANRRLASKEPSETAWEKLGITPLMRATRTGELESCRHLLESSAAVDTADEAGWTALMSAAAEGHERIVQLLLDHSADVASESYDSATALHAATASGHADVVGQLLGAGADSTRWMRGRGPFSGGGGWDPIKLAANNGDGHTLQLLADAGAYLVDHDAALYLHRAYVAMGREVKLFRAGQTETFQTHDDAVYHPDLFAIGSPFQLPDGIPPCVQELINTHNDGCGVTVTRDRDTSAPVAFFGTSPADGSIASFVAKGRGKPDLGPDRATDGRTEHIDLKGWRVHGYTLALQELLHKDTPTPMAPLLQVAAGVGKLEIVRELLRRGAVPTKGFEGLIETVQERYWNIPNRSRIRRLLVRYRDKQTTAANN